MKEITVAAFNQVLEAEKNNTSVDFVNVCTPAEFNEKHITDVRNVPLDELVSRLSEFKDKKTIYIHCRSGKRGAKAAAMLEKAGVSATVVNVTGGIMAWEQSGFSTGSNTSRLPIFRQTLIAIGFLVILFSILATTIHTCFVVGVILVGVGLLVAGFTGWCGMAMLLSKMPWNK